MLHLVKLWKFLECKENTKKQNIRSIKDYLNMWKRRWFYEYSVTKILEKIKHVKYISLIQRKRIKATNIKNT